MELRVPTGQLFVWILTARGLPKKKLNVRVQP